MLSLRTKDREAAKRLIPSYRIETDTRLDGARAKLSGAPAGSNAPPVAVSPWLSEYAQGQSEAARQDEAEREARYEAREPLRKALEAAFQRSTLQMTPEEAAMRDFLREKEYDFTVSEERRVIRGAERALERRGEPLPLACPDTDAASSAPVAASPSADPTWPMLDTIIIDRWAAERKVVAKGVDTHRAVARWFYERIGRKPVGEITRKDVLTFKDKLVEEGQTPARCLVPLCGDTERS
ncbi:MAG: hypothetical protein H0W74_11545 [Sphingosinicella sp.]|nr:hypothetical protein [Sphingosinicella sp.]